MYETVYLEHHGVKGMRWGVRRYQNEDGTLTAKGRARLLDDARRYERKVNTSVADNYFAKSRRAKLSQKAKDARYEVRKSDALIRKQKLKSVDRDQILKKKKLSVMKKMSDEELEQYVTAQEKRKKLEKRFTDLDNDSLIDDQKKFDRIKNKSLSEMTDDELDYYISRVETRARLEKRFNDDTYDKNKISFDEVKNKSLKNMTDDELEVYVNTVERRNNLEQRYNNLNPKQVSAGKQMVMSFSKTFLKQPAEDVGKQLANSVMVKITNDVVLPGLGITEKDLKIKKK